MLADKYADAVHAVSPSVQVKLIDGVDHMGIVGNSQRRCGGRRRRCQRTGRIMTSIGPKEAAQALNDIEQIVQRVRQSRIYDIASQIMIAAGVLVLAGNVANYVSPRHSAYIWITVNVLTVASVAALATMGGRPAGVQGVRFQDACRVRADLCFRHPLLRRTRPLRPA